LDHGPHVDPHYGRYTNGGLLGGDDAVAQEQRAEQPNGAFRTVGPTGSGKTPIPTSC